jgi:DNA polymerase-3 subunit gamma/tau
MSEYIVSARKYRPDSFETLIGQDNIARTLKNSIIGGKLAHAYLFCGPRGVGKTTTARIFAKAINCAHPSEGMDPCGECESCRSFQEGRSYCIHELDAASNNGVDDIKTLMDQVQIPPQVGKYSVYIIDEVHMLSLAAFNAFLKTLEEPPAHAIFILATTEKHKILPTILSRCQTFDFSRISVPDMVRNLRGIASKEGITIDDESLHVIARKADGAMRDALTLFDQTIAFCGTDVKYADVIKNLGVLDDEYSFSLVDAFLQGDYGTALRTFDEAGKLVGGLCSGTTVLEASGVLAGRRATGYTGYGAKLTSARFVADEVAVWDGNIVTSQGPCAPYPFAFKVMEALGIDPQPIKDRLLYDKAGGR